MAVSYHNRAAPRVDLGRVVEAEADLRRALEIRRILYPRGSSDNAGTLTSLGILLRDEGRLDEARAVFVEAAELNRTIYEGPHFELGRSYNGLGTLAYSRGRFAEAADWFRQTVAVWQATMGEDNPTTLRTRNNLAVALHRCGQQDEARREFDEVLAARLRVLEPDAFDLAFSYKGLGWLLLDQGQFAEADSLLAAALRILRTNRADDHPVVAETRLGLGACRLHERDFAAAETLLVLSYADLVAAYDPGHDLLARGRLLLRELFTATGRPVRVREYAEAGP